MIDTITRDRVLVETGEGPASYIIIPLPLLDQATALFNTNQVPYWVDEEVLSVDGEPEVAFINLGSQADPALAQRLLDSIP